MDYIKVLKDSGLTLKKISEKLGVGERTIQAYYRGDRSLPDTTKKLIDYEFGLKTVEEETEKNTTAQDHIKLLEQSLKSKNEIIELLRENNELLKGQVELLKFQMSQLKKNGT